jgi:hypothetical protein
MIIFTGVSLVIAGLLMIITSGMMVMAFVNIVKDWRK